MLHELENLSQFWYSPKYSLYHHKCRPSFTMKKDLERIEKENQVADSEGTSYQSTPRRSTKSPTGEFILPKNASYAVKWSSLARQELKRY